MRKVAVAIVRANCAKRPRLRRVGRVGPGVTVLPLGNADQLGLAVAGDVGERGRLVVGLGKDDVPFPMAGLSLGILEPRGVSTGKADDENVAPIVVVEVVCPSEDIVAVLIVFAERALE